MKAYWIQAHEKLIAFCFLGASVVALATLVMFKTPENEMALGIVDAAVGGFLLALGGAANALFRSKSDDAAETALQTAVDKVPPVTGEAAVSPQRLTVEDLDVQDAEAPAWTR